MLIRLFFLLVIHTVSAGTLHAQEMGDTYPSSVGLHVAPLSLLQNMKRFRVGGHWLKGKNSFLFDVEFNGSLAGMERYDALTFFASQGTCDYRTLSFIGFQPEYRRMISETEKWRLFAGAAMLWNKAESEALNEVERTIDRQTYIYTGSRWTREKLGFVAKLSATYSPDDRIYLDLYSGLGYSRRERTLDLGNNRMPAESSSDRCEGVENLRNSFVSEFQLGFRFGVWLAHKKPSS